MDTKMQRYEAPSTEVIEVKHEGIICASEVKSGNTITDWLLGDTTDDDLFI